MNEFEKETVKLFYIDNGYSVMKLTGIIMNKWNIRGIPVYKVFFVEKKKHVILSEFSVNALTS